VLAYWPKILRDRNPSLLVEKSVRFASACPLPGAEIVACDGKTIPLFLQNEPVRQRFTAEGGEEAGYPRRT